MLIHIEGADLCGKTTLIDKMSMLFKNVVVFKTPKDLLPRHDSLTERETIWNYYINTLKGIIRDFEQDSDQIYILDRFFLSELAYGEAIRGYDSKDMQEEIKEVKRLIQEIESKRGYKIIYLHDDVNSIRERFKKDGDDYVKNKDYFRKIQECYYKQIVGLNDIVPNIVINVFKSKDYWNKIIEELLLSNFKYIRHG